MALHFPSFTRLSYDVLREIILYDSVYTMEPDERDEPPLHFHVVSPPIVASHVCRSWRHALLSDSTMWTCLSIPNMKPSGVMELLRRSGSSLLSVFIKLKNDRRLDCVDTLSMLSAVFRELHRFKVLHMQINPESYGDTQLKPGVLKRLVRQALSYLLRQPAPKLQTFFVWYTYVLDGPHKTNFLKTLFSGNAPNLKHIHHQISGDLGEIGCPLFHDLSELHLSLIRPVNTDHFLEFLELSPRLNFLRVHINYHHDDVLSYVETSKRRVNLPNLQTLVLEVNHAVEVMDLIFANVTFPSSVKWQVTTQYMESFEDASHVFQYLPRPQVPFTSLYVQLTNILAFTFEEKPLSNHTDYFNRHKLGYAYSDFIELMDLWHPLMKLIESYVITHLSFEVDPPYYISPEKLFEFDVYPIIIAPLSSNLESLTVTYKKKIYGEDSFSDGKYNPCLSYLSEFMPNLGASLASEYSMNTSTTDSMKPTSDPDLDLVPTSSRFRPPINRELVASTGTSAFPYPRLQELHVELPGALKEIDAVMLCACVSTRRREGYPLRIFVRCAQITESAKSILGHDDDIRVSVNPVTMKVIK